ncbi:MAG: metal-sulfur cluster assembly factor [Campylobacter sp.]|nr:metal-sulfur cluster assembly factor [Campylobacter sp.]
MGKVDEIYEELKNVLDPEVGFDIVSLGLIYGVKFDEDSRKAHIDMTLSTKSCPLHDLILKWVYDAAMRVGGVEECDIDLVWEPTWSIDMATDEVKKALSF